MFAKYMVDQKFSKQAASYTTDLFKKIIFYY